jgi:peptidoglycan/xylan/chitin deacetylase (PgdA/CDA1 family)
MILNYHDVSPPGTQRLSRLHTVSVDVFAEQVAFLAARFDIIDIDSWRDRKDRRGTICLTFDDGYLSSLRHGLDVLESFGVPAAFFLNGAVLAGAAFWRDRVRWILDQGLVEDFLEWSAGRGLALDGLSAANFYEGTRRASLSSLELDALIEAWLKARGLAPPRLTALASELPDHPLLTYGSHSWRHTILASLTSAERQAEMDLGHRAIKELPLDRARRTTILALPFGNGRACGPGAAAAAQAAGHSGLLYASGGTDLLPESAPGFVVGDRFAAPTTVEGLVRWFRR